MLTVLNILCLQGKCAGIYIKQNHFVNGKAHWKQKTVHKTKFYIWHNAIHDNWKIGEDTNFPSPTSGKKLKMSKLSRVISKE